MFRKFPQELFGYFTVFSSAICFYLATVSLRWAGEEITVNIPAFVLYRFLTGFVLIAGILLARRKSARPKRFDLILIRAATNILAVYLFYYGVNVTSAVEANILNMTYPVFIALFTWLFFKGKNDWIGYSMSLAAVIGIWLVLLGNGSEISLNPNHFWALGSGVVASWAIIFLNFCRRHDDTDTILFWVFGLGAVAVWALFPDSMYVPERRELYYLLLSGGLGVAGQFFLTLGFRYVTAVEGGIISSSRILMAAILGPLIANEAPLLLTGWIGALTIFTANVYLAARKSRGYQSR